MSFRDHGAALGLGLGGRHSRRVDRLRFILPVAASIMLIIVLAWPWLTGGYHGLIMPVLQRASGHDVDPMRMHRPRYVGRTEQQDPYEVTAASAFLDPGNPKLIHLDQLTAVVDRVNTDSVQVRANEGAYDRDRRTLDLKGDLELHFGEGYIFETSAARVDFEQGDVMGNDTVTGAGPIGTLAADRFKISDGGGHLEFKGRVQVVYQPTAPTP